MRSRKKVKQMYRRIITVMFLAAALCVAGGSIQATNAGATICPQLANVTCYYPTVSQPIYYLNGVQVTNVPVGSNVRIVTQVDGDAPGTSCSRKQGSGGWDTTSFQTDSNGHKVDDSSWTMGSAGTFTFEVYCPANGTSGDNTSQLTVTEGPPPPPSGSPSGNLTSIDTNTGVVTGKACDPANLGQSVGVLFFIDGPPGGSTWASAGQTTANVSDGSVCNGVGGHGFSFTLPSWLRDGRSHNLWAYGVRIGGSSNWLLDGSNKPFQLGGGSGAPTLQFDTSKTAMFSDESAILYWSSTNATNCIASDSWTGNVGTRNQSPTGSLPVRDGGWPYTLTCTGPGGQVSKTIYIGIVDASERNAGNGPGNQNNDPVSDWDAYSQCHMKSESNWDTVPTHIPGRYGGKLTVTLNWCVSNGMIRKASRIIKVEGANYPASFWHSDGITSIGPCNENCDNYVTLFGVRQTVKNIWVKAHYSLCVGVRIIGVVCVQQKTLTVGVRIHGDGTREDTYDDSTP